MSPPASPFELKRAELTERLADLALRDGMSPFALRDLAAALATSDRMLLYYFTSKSELVRAVLRRISRRMAAALAGSALDRRLPPDRFLTQAWSLLTDPALAPYMGVWAEITALGARGEQPYREAARAGIVGWRNWVAERLDVAEGPHKAVLAAGVLTLLEGATLLELSLPGSTAGVRELFAEALAGAA
ncbi:TetR family transcriptional regulator [Phenylobacterium sp.]|uniref:TetR family transcriptional regulator n=1 Tax=Phenylobacterium sp. TaxID=1871053 RepID=UPI002DEC696B|nr:TetR family transcriptional regulator [Phenylobacterium sp.]